MPKLTVRLTLLPYGMAELSPYSVINTHHVFLSAALEFKELTISDSEYFSENRKDDYLQSHKSHKSF